MPLEMGGYVTGITYDTTELQPSSQDWVLWIMRGLNDVPSVRGEDDVIPGAPGRVARARQADVRVIELEGWIMAQGATWELAIANFRQSVQALQALFDPTLDPRVLSAVLEDGSVATINARVVPPLVVEERVASHVARIAVQMESLDPDWVIAS